MQVETLIFLFFCKKSYKQKRKYINLLFSVRLLDRKAINEEPTNQYTYCQ